MIVRDATTADAPAITDLANALIATTTVTWTETLQTADERRAWLRRQEDSGFPVLVAEVEGRVDGFASYTHFRGAGTWPGYVHTAELTIHVDAASWGAGIGRRLIRELVERAVTSRIHVLVAAIDGENDASVLFHRRVGFVEVGRMPQIGHKFGRWLDLVLMQRIIDDRPSP